MDQNNNQNQDQQQQNAAQEGSSPPPPAVVQPSQEQTPTPLPVPQVKEPTSSQPQQPLVSESNDSKDEQGVLAPPPPAVVQPSQEQTPVPPPAPPAPQITEPVKEQAGVVHEDPPEKVDMDMKGAQKDGSDAIKMDAQEVKNVPLPSGGTTFSSADTSEAVSETKGDVSKTESKKKSKLWLWLVIGLLVVAALSISAYMVLTSRNGTLPPEENPPTTQVPEKDPISDLNKSLADLDAVLLELEADVNFETDLNLDAQL